MPRLTPLPEQLKYLQPFRKHVAKLRPEEIDENMDLSVLDELLLKRIVGLSAKEGKALLERDQSILEKWSRLPDFKDNGGMRFLKGYLMGLPDLVDYLQSKTENQQERLEVSMEFPKEAKVSHREGGVIQVACFQGTLLVFPQEPDLAKTNMQVMRGSQHRQLPQLSVESVEFGNAKGVKSSSQITNVGSEICYILEVPGGFVHISFSRRGATGDFNEAELEKYFHTIRVVHAS